MGHAPTIKAGPPVRRGEGVEIRFAAQSSACLRTIRVVTVIGYRPWLVRHIGAVLVSLVLVVVGQHGALTINRAEYLPHVTLRPIDPAFSPMSLADVRIPNLGRGPTGPLPIRTMQMVTGSAAVAPGDGDEDRWSVLLRPSTDA